MSQHTHYVPEPFTTEHPELPIGETIEDELWVRLPIRNETGSWPDDYFYAPTRCYCEDVDGAGYTFSDEHGDCNFCRGWVTDINGHQEKLIFDSVKEKIEEYLVELQGGKMGIPTLEQLQSAGNLHMLLEGE